ncbi:MAG: hypothetical protein ABIO05_07280 [Ferruginibacter sp.]
MKVFYLSFLLLLLACNNAGTTSTENITLTPERINTINDLQPGCYQMIIDKDSALFKVDIKGDSVFGNLVYNRFEKDDNTGAFTGRADSDKIIGWYRFQSEGMISVREVIFKIMGNQLAEAYGDISAMGDTAVFKYPHALNYEETHLYTKINCN